MGEADKNKYGFEKILLHCLPLVERIQPSQSDAAHIFIHLELLWSGLSFSCCHPAMSVHFYLLIIRTPSSELHTSCHPLLTVECASDFIGPLTWLFPLPSCNSLGCPSYHSNLNLLFSKDFFALTFTFSPLAVLCCGLALDYVITQNDASSEIFNL